MYHRICARMTIVAPKLRFFETPAYGRNNRRRGTRNDVLRFSLFFFFLTDLVPRTFDNVSFDRQQRRLTYEKKHFYVSPPNRRSSRFCDIYSFIFQLFLWIRCNLPHVRSTARFDKKQFSWNNNQRLALKQLIRKNIINDIIDFVNHTVGATDPSV